MLEENHSLVADADHDFSHGWLRDCRAARRKAKDTAEAARPLVEFFRSEKGKMMVGQLQQVLGIARKLRKITATSVRRRRICNSME